MEKECKIETNYDYFYDGKWVSYEFIKKLVKEKILRSRIKKHLAITF